MRKFERITVERGVGYVRDTGIAVGEIVRSVRHGNELLHILSEYPLIKAEDIFESLAYAINDLTQAIHGYAHDARPPLGNVIGYGQILGDNTEPVSDEQRIQWSQAIVDNGGRTIGMWDALSDWVSVIYGKAFQDLGPLALPKLLGEMILPYLPHYAKFEAAIADDLPPIVGNHALNTVFRTLLHDSPAIPLKPVGTIKVFPANNKVSVQIFRQYYKGISGPYHADESYMFQNTSQLSTAAFVIRQHGSELQVHPTEEGITFEFQLPIWKDPQT